MDLQHALDEASTSVEWPIDPMALANEIERDGAGKDTLVDFFGKTAAMIALEYGHTELPTLSKLIRAMKPADFAAVDKWNHNLLTYAALASE